LASCRIKRLCRISLKRLPRKLWIDPEDTPGLSKLVSVRVMGPSRLSLNWLIIMISNLSRVLVKNELDVQVNQISQPQQQRQRVKRKKRQEEVEE
jgi:hypothetical protein